MTSEKNTIEKSGKYEDPIVEDLALDITNYTSALNLTVNTKSKGILPPFRKRTF